MGSAGADHAGAGPILSLKVGAYPSFGVLSGGRTPFLTCTSRRMG